MNKTLLFAALVFICSAMAAPSVQAEGISKQQGDEILKELKSIRALLEEKKGEARSGPVVKAPERVKVSTIDGVALGSKKAPLVLIEFTDYQCPYCKRFYDTTFAELKKKYIDTGKLRFISRNLPLPFHKHAESAALAASCGNDQNRYWQMRESIFSNPRALQPEALSAYAKVNGLNVKRFDICMMKKRHLKKIKQDMADANAIGITGTPSFVLARSGGKIVEGEKIIGAYPFAAFESKIEALLQQTE